MRVELSALEPAPTAVVSNLPYSIATPVLLRTIAELPEVRAWTVMVQREIADRLRAEPGLADLRRPERARAARLRGGAASRRGPGRIQAAAARGLGAPAAGSPRAGGSDPALAGVVRGAFAHRRKPLAGSLELAGGPSRGAVREALGELGLEPDARAEALGPGGLRPLAARLGAG